MVTINRAFNEITCKIVYYGPGRGGKTTNLEVVHGQVPWAIDPVPGVDDVPSLE